MLPMLRTVAPVAWLNALLHSWLVSLAQQGAISLGAGMSLLEVMIIKFTKQTVTLAACVKRGPKLSFGR